MKTIWKFELDFVDDQVITAPGLTKVIAARIAGTVSRPTLLVWAEVHTDFPEQSVEVCIRGTGHDLQGRNLEHITTFFEQRHGTDFVWHIYQGDRLS